MSFEWSVVFSALSGAVCGVLFAYSSYQFFENKTRSSIFNGAVFLTLPFAVYFSVNQTSVVTQLFYFLPVFGGVFKYVSILVAEDKEQKAAELRTIEYQAERRMKEEEERLERQRIEKLKQENLDIRIRDFGKE